MNLKKLTVKVKDGFFKHAIIYSFLVFLFGFGYIFFDLDIDYIGLIFFLAITFILAIIALIVGTLVSKENATRVGVGFGLSMLTILILEFLVLVIELGFIAASVLYRITKLPILIPILFPIGIITTWLGSLVGDFLRGLGNKKTWRVSPRVGFLLNFFCPITIYFLFRLYLRLRN